MELLHTDDESSSTNKYYINCQEFINNNGNTEKFLNNLELIDQNKLPSTKSALMSQKILMQGILKKYRNVIIKLGITDSIQNEWIIYNKLKEYKIPGILKYYCFFSCADDFKVLHQKFSDNKEYKPAYLCNGPGNSLNIILMEVGIHNLADFPWKTSESLQSCIKQSLLTVLQAYLTFGFYHEDCHPRNFIIKKTNKKQRLYTINGIINTVELHGYETFMMDLEESKQNQSVKQLYTDLYLFCNKIDGMMINKIKSSDADIFISQLKKFKENIQPLDTIKVIDIIDIIDNIAKNIILVHANIEGGRYKLPWRKIKIK